MNTHHTIDFTSISQDASSGSLECGICLDNEPPADIWDNGRHSYHTECLRQWLNVSETCPQCRQSISSRTITTLAPNRLDLTHSNSLQAQLRDYENNIIDATRNMMNLNIPFNETLVEDFNTAILVCAAHNELELLRWLLPQTIALRSPRAPYLLGHALGNGAYHSHPQIVHHLLETTHFTSEDLNNAHTLAMQSQNTQATEEIQRTIRDAQRSRERHYRTIGLLGLGLLITIAVTSRFLFIHMDSLT